LIYSLSWTFLVGADGRSLRDGNTISTQYKSTEVANETDQRPHMSIHTAYPVDIKRKLKLFGSDDRQAFKDEKYPWCTVGKVRTSTGSCTGTMIGPSLMLTAQHCLKCNSDGTIGWMTFTSAYYDGYAPFGSAEATQVYWDHRIPCDKSLFESQFAFDYVVVKLDERIGDDVGWMGFKVYQTDWNGGDYWMHIGYGGDVLNGERPLFHAKSSIQSVDAYVNSAGTKSYFLTHAIDSTGGHSGGPLFGFWGDDSDPYIVGVHNSNGGGAAGGPGLHTLIANLRSKYD